MDFKSLAIETITDPAAAADKILSRQFENDVIWTGFALNVVLSVFLYALQGFLLGMPSNALFPNLSPVMFGMFLIGLQLAYSVGSLVVGNRLGGQARFMPIFSLLVWLRFVNIAVQFIAIIMVFVMAPLAAILNLVAAVYGIYVLAHFTNVGFGLNSLGKSLGVIFMAGLGAMVAVLFLMGLFVPTILETSNV